MIRRLLLAALILVPLPFLASAGHPATAQTICDPATGNCTVYGPPFGTFPTATPSASDYCVGIHGSIATGVNSLFPCAKIPQLPNGNSYNILAFPNVYCNGVNDDTAGINAAIAAVPNYATIYNHGVCTFSSSINFNRSNVTLAGDGYNSSQFVDIAPNTADAFDAFVVNGGTGYANVVLRDFLVQHINIPVPGNTAIPSRTGCTFRLENVTNGEVQHIKILNAYKGVCNGSDTAFTDNNSGNLVRYNNITVLAGGTCIQDNGDTTFSSGVNDFSFNKCYGPTDQTSIGFKFPGSGGTDTIYLNFNDFFNFGYGLYLNTTSNNEILQNVWGYQNNMDGSVVSGIFLKNLQGTNNNINEWHMVRQWAIGNGTGSSIPLTLESTNANGNLSSINFADGTFVEGGSTYCAFIQGWTNSTITGSAFKACNSSGTGTYGIDFAGTQNSNDSIINNDFRPGVPWPQPSQSGLGLNYAVSMNLANTNMLIADNKMTGMTIAGMILTGSSAGNGNNFHDNLGYNPVGPQTAPTLPPSGTPLTNPFPQREQVCISGGTVSAIAIGGTVTGLTAECFSLEHDQSFTVTYSVLPTTDVWFGS